MKRALFLSLSVVLMVVGLCGCAMTEDDKEFYTRHWVRPDELDAERPTKMPPHPETTGSLGPEAASVPSAPSKPGYTTDGTEWTPPTGR